MKTMGRAAASAALAMSVVCVSALSLAQQDTKSGGVEGQTRQGQTDQGQRHPEPPDQGQTHPGQTDQGQPDQGQTEQSPKTRSRAAQGRAEQEIPTEAEAQVVTAAETVQKIDKAGRKLTLQDPNGQTFDLKAGPDVDLDQLHLGDRVYATYYEEVAVGIGKHGEAAPKAAVRAVQRGGVTAKQAAVTAKILSVDTADDTVTVRGADGKRHTLKVVDPQLQAQLASLKPGDSMDVTYTQAVAIAVEPAAAEPAR